MSAQWENSLTKICDIYFHSNTKIEWIIVGSVGSVLQGCNMNPGDLDIYVKHPNGVTQFAELLKKFTPSSKGKHRSSNDWFSTKEEPILNQTFPSGFSWTKARWRIANFNVEVVHISNPNGIPDAITGEGIWEGGQYIWSLAKKMRFGTYTIPVVPLEIQLESNFRRNRQDRVQSIISALKENGHDKELIDKALSSQNLSYFYSQLK